MEYISRLLEAIAEKDLYPNGEARIRVATMATQTAAQIDCALVAFRDMGKEIGVI
jgi:hypothetical protein